MAYCIPVIDITGDDDIFVTDRSNGVKVGPINIIYTSDSELGIDHDNEKRRVKNKTRDNNFQDELKPGRAFESPARAYSGVSSQCGDNNKCYSNQYGPKCSNLQNDNTSNYGIDLIEDKDRSFSRYNTSNSDNSSSKKRRHKQHQCSNDNSHIGSFNYFKGETGEDDIDRSCYAKREKEEVSNSLLFSSEGYTDRSGRIIDELSVYKENMRIDGEYGGFVVIDRDEIPADEFNEYLESQKFIRSGKTGLRSFCFIL